MKAKAAGKSAKKGNADKKVAETNSAQTVVEDKDGVTVLQRPEEKDPVLRQTNDPIFGNNEVFKKKNDTTPTPTEDVENPFADLEKKRKF